MSKNNKVSFWQFLGRNRVVVPIIQRDYAQGRKGKEALRKKFIGDIKKALDTKSELKLDFVYGAVDRGELSPLDGQQRLTTLWLLHWYVANKAKKLSDAGVKECLRNFSYETRVSSRLFCQHLVECDLDLNSGTSVANSIRNQSWFRSSWGCDPTVQSMLRMLSGETRGSEDCLEGAFGARNDCDWEGYWALLAGEECPIVFYCLDLVGLHQTDELYIKMNARGEPLTGFENLKADLIGYIHEQEMSKELSKEEQESWQKFADDKNIAKFDALWSNVFWRGRSCDHHIDEICFAFLNRYLLNRWVISGACDSKVFSNEDPVAFYFYGRSPYAREVDDSRISYSSFDNYKKVVTISTLQDLFSTLKNIEKFLQEKGSVPLPSWDKNAATILLPQYNERDSKDCFVQDFDNDEIRKVDPITQPQRIVFYALCRFFQEGWERSESEDLKDWMRVVWNLVENSEVSTIPAMVGCLRLIDKLSYHSHDIISYLSRIDIKDVGSTFAGEQLKEELMKARKITSDEKWKYPLVEAEGLAVLKGRVDVLFVNGVETTLEEFKTELEVLKSVIKKSEKQAYYLQKVILSHCNSSLPEGVIDLAENDAAKKVLLTETLKDCFREVKGSEIISNKIAWINDVCQSKLLEYSRNDGKCISAYGGVAVLWGTLGRRWSSFGNDVWGNVILGKNRSLLTITDGVQLGDKNLKVGQSDFVSGRNIMFSYEGHWFQWWGLPNDEEYDVYLLNGDRKQQPEERYLSHEEECEKKGDAKKYYCFNVDRNETSTSFAGKLKMLIKDASKVSEAQGALI